MEVKQDEELHRQPLSLTTFIQREFNVTSDVCILVTFSHRQSAVSIDLVTRK